MDNDVNDDLSQECIECKVPLKRGAKLCSQCKSYQDWRKHLHLPNITLALLTALISVLGLAIPTAYEFFHTPNSKAAIVDIAVDGTRIRATAMNWGDADAVLGSVVIKSDHLAPNTSVRLVADETALIRPGTSIMSFDVIPLLNEAQSYSLAVEAMTRILTEQPPDSTLLIEVMQSDGQHQIHEMRLTHTDLHQVLRANADRCSAIEEPNFANGCIGTGELDEERYRISGPRLDDDDQVID